MTKKIIVDDGICAKRLKEMRESLGLTQQNIADIISVSKGTISRYESRKHSPQVSHVRIIAEHLGISGEWLAGVSDEKYVDEKVEYKKVPIIGTIAAGKPIFAQEDIIDWECVPKSLAVDFCLLVKGDSMINAGIYDGSIVYIRQQPDVENGEIAAVIIDGEATLKRVYKMNGNVLLKAENPNSEDKMYKCKEMKDIKILGKAISYKQEVR
jgi:repressor LexA